METYSILTIPLLRAVMPAAHQQDLEDYCEPLNVACREHGITTPVRQAMFLAQIAEESDQLWHNREHYGTNRGEEYASGAAYEGRKDLGNVIAGDGVRFKGRGLLQETGHRNYDKAGRALGVDLVSHPELLLEPEWSCKSAAYYWQSHGCNELADAGLFLSITKLINGGLNGEQRREQFWVASKAALAI